MPSKTEEEKQRKNRQTNTGVFVVQTLKVEEQRRVTFPSFLNCGPAFQKRGRQMNKEKKIPLTTTKEHKQITSSSPFGERPVL